MRTLIAYRTKYGTAAACARTLAEKIGGETALADLADARDVNLREYDVVIIGGSIYAGKLQRKVVSFCEKNRRILLQRPVGIFLCCLYEGEEAILQLQSAFPDWLLAHAFARALPGGEVHYDRLTFLDRLLVRRLPHRTGDFSRMRPEALDELAAAAKSSA
ncbi:MAG: flavodoxin domain-containing protein [Spirochaetia bacterium]